MDQHKVYGLDLFEEFMLGTESSLVIGPDGKFVDLITRAAWMGWQAGRITMYNQVKGKRG